MVKKTTLLLLSFFIYIFSFAQNVALNGKVLNAKNEPVPGATISVTGLDKSRAANVEGRFTILLAPGKKYTIVVSSVGYGTKSLEDVEIKANEEKFFNSCSRRKINII